VADGVQKLAALQDIDVMIQAAIDAAAHLGAEQSRVAMQSEALSRFSDAISTGIGGLVDADMEASAARIRALDVRKQLAIEALSIANQTPRNVLALFRA
jgi:flagellin